MVGYYREPISKIIMFNAFKSYVAGERWIFEQKSFDEINSRIFLQQFFFFIIVLQLLQRRYKKKTQRAVTKDYSFIILQKQKRRKKTKN